MSHSSLCLLFTMQDDATASVTWLPGPDFPCISPLTIEPHGVEKLLSSRKFATHGRLLDLMKSQRVLKIFGFGNSSSLLFRQSLQTGELPIQWKKAWTTPVFKKGGRADSANYRPVSLTSIASKSLEHIVCMHISRGHADRQCILGEDNHGSKAKHST